MKIVIEDNDPEELVRQLEVLGNECNTRGIPYGMAGRYVAGSLLRQVKAQMTKPEITEEPTLVGDTVEDDDGDTWAKTASGNWVSLVSGRDGVPWDYLKESYGPLKAVWE